jgi:hypothetical protein
MSGAPVFGDCDDESVQVGVFTGLAYADPAAERTERISASGLCASASLR